MLAQVSEKFELAKVQVMGNRLYSCGGEQLQI